MSNPTVLLIDYEPASIEQMKVPLLAAGYNVEVVFDGLAGLKAFYEMKPDLVLIEAMIPKKHGFEVCQEIKKTPEGKDTPVVIATSIYKGRKYRNQALKNYGCDEYLEKPVASEDLMAVCRRYLKEVKEQVIEATEQNATAPDEGAADPVMHPEQPRKADQGLNNLDAMNEKEIADKLDEILGAFGEAVDDAKDPGVGEVSQPLRSTELISDQEMVMELLDEVGIAEPQEAAFEEEPLTEPEPVVDPATETEPDPVMAAEPQSEIEVPVVIEPVLDAQAEVAAQVDEVLPDGAYEGRTAEEYLSGVSIPDPSALERTSGTRFLGLGIPAWIGIAVAVTAVVVGGMMLLGGSDDAVIAPPEESVAAVAKSFQRPVSPGALEPAGPEDATLVDGGTTDQAGGQDVQPAQIDPTPPVKKELSPPVKQTAKVRPPARKEVSPPVKQTPKKVTTPAKKEVSPPVNTVPAQVKPEPAVLKPALTEAVPQIKDDPGPEPAPVESREVLAPQEQVVQTAAPVIKPVVQERAQVVLARPGDLVPLNSVDTPPVQQVNVAAKYHPMARKMGQQGTVQLSLLIDETGAVADVKVVKEIPNSTLNQMAVKAARRWSYEPALKDSVPVKVWKQVSVEFRL